ncbi:hypothetical protein F2Q68_00044662 [Brassica cretica]|uniref:Uncharacterized protein n=1 Tax=Brassica cretica TaxID=69181 RepID=A0A8S9LM71_BRACR|nr:hypothetical protein F2Q68_00044662 [Brassica cretica]
MTAVTIEEEQFEDNGAAAGYTIYSSERWILFTDCRGNPLMEVLSYGMVVLRGLASLWIGFTLDWVEEEDERILSDM